MTQQPKKAASENLLHILKSVMDVKARNLRQVVSDGETATEELPILLGHMSNVRDYITRNCRYEANEANESEQQLKDMEYQASGIQKKIDAGRVAATEMAHVDAFNKTYHATVIQPHITKMNLVASGLNSAIAALQDKINLYQYYQDYEIYDIAGDYDELEQCKSRYVAAIEDYRQEISRIVERMQILQNTK